jgi:hypothetical protein
LYADQSAGAPDMFGYIGAQMRGSRIGYKAAMDSADHLLLVDDDPGIRELLTQYLRRQGLQATAVPDGARMREALATQRVDLEPPAQRQTALPQERQRACDARFP